MPAKWLAFKDTVRTTGFNPNVLEILRAAKDCAPDLSGDTVVVTSLNDSTHSPTSAHYSDDGVDIRTHPTSPTVTRLGAIIPHQGETLDEVADRWTEMMSRRLGKNYDVIYEKAKRHIHVEYDRED